MVRRFMMTNVDDRCPVTAFRGGVEYRCSKKAGHVHVPGDADCEAIAPEYVGVRQPHWRELFLEARPILEWMAEHEEVVGAERANEARRVLVRLYVAASPRPSITKVRETWK